jgi:hypothetical protein
LEKRGKNKNRARNRFMGANIHRLRKSDFIT